MTHNLFDEVATKAAQLLPDARFETIEDVASVPAHLPTQPLDGWHDWPTPSDFGALRVLYQPPAEAAGFAPNITFTALHVETQNIDVADLIAIVDLSFSLTGAITVTNRHTRVVGSATRINTLASSALGRTPLRIISCHYASTSGSGGQIYGSTATVPKGHPLDSLPLILKPIE
ncbi:hypothetical protein GOARA_044_00020 [Gordonia araii NBRC 100433]|uniref:Uncharacterized protein n=1 Tax=Gordonia araii NBRC 100433 TaxID=1073574 RepID=G7H1A3_9ACTN|nr:hypothetical protein GOARA_044_00020 [Gordonia araii NBRC 100433]